MISRFEEEYKKASEGLNEAQKEAVESIDGPVMVVAGPGTGKTQILALRIANIRNKTDIQPDGILCLTFTNSGVSAMRERLRKYLSSDSSKVNIFTFHSFGMKIIEEFYSVLDLDSAPKLLDDTGGIALCDEILHNNDWVYLRPRSDASKYFRDLKSLISLLKRERMESEDFLIEIERDIKNLKESPESISSRGESKGQLKKEVLKKIESLDRTREVVKFFELYEEYKKEKNVFDYDDVLVNLVKIIENSDDARDTIRERYLYILIDEHQDSSGIQNEFLQKVWGEIEQPNIFVVGDDRQLIYGFGGASLAYFEGFKHSFGKAKLITLVDNYRSTQVILDSAHILLKSSLVEEKLISHHKENHPMRLVECDYPRDEIISCVLDIKEKIKKGVDINDCAILVPKNHQVRSAVTVLRDMGLPVSSYGTLNLFASSEAVSFLRVLKIVVDPYDNVSLAQSFFDNLSGIKPLDAHKFIREENMKKFSLVDIQQEKQTLDLFTGDTSLQVWIKKLTNWIDASKDLGVYSLVQKIGEEFLLNQSKNHEELISRVEIIRTILHILLSQIENKKNISLKDFLNFIDRLEYYGEHIPLAVFSADEGVKVLTLHSSKGLEFDSVWIAHMDEGSLSSGRHNGFTLPERVEEKVEKKNEEVMKRQLYVAITRAKRFCTLSYSLHSYTGASQELAHIVADLPEEIFEKQTAGETEKAILKHNPKAYVEKEPSEIKTVDQVELAKLVAKEYSKKNVSVSLLNNFFECPWKWYFRNLLQLPEPKSESLEFGNAVHAVIDKILKNKKIPSVKELEEIVSEIISKINFGDEKKQESMKKEVLIIVSKWVKNRLSEIKINHETEKSVSVKDDNFPHLNIYGKIDLIERLDGENVRVTDFKTGTPKKKSEIEKLDEEGRLSGYLRQLAMYSYLLGMSSSWKIDVRESRLEFLEAKDPKENFYDKIITQEEINLLIQDIKDYDELLKKGEWLERPCNYNSYGKHTECEYCKRAKIYK